MHGRVAARLCWATYGCIIWIQRRYINRTKSTPMKGGIVKQLGKNVKKQSSLPFFSTFPDCNKEHYTGNFTNYAEAKMCLPCSKYLTRNLNQSHIPDERARAKQVVLTGLLYSHVINVGLNLKLLMHKAAVIYG